MKGYSLPINPHQGEAEEKMRPAQVLDMHVDLLERLGEELFRGVNGSIIRAEVASRYENGYSPEAKKDGDEAAEMLMDMMRRHVQAAYAYRVTEDMVDLMTFAADGLEPEDLWDPSLAPTGCGIVRFEKPVVLAGTDDPKDPKLMADWAIWGPGLDGRTMIWFWADLARPDELWSARLGSIANASRADLIRAHGRWALVAWDAFRTGISMGPKVLPLPGRALTEDEVQALANTAFGDARQSVAGLALEAEKAAQKNPDQPIWQSNDARYMHALWLLLGQTITVLHDEPLERASKRRAVKKGLPPRVTTIALRRPEQKMREGDVEVHVEWQHRWIVRGHWRWQAYGSRANSSIAHDGSPGAHKMAPDGTCMVPDCDFRRKRIWVNPHVKGPEGKPLKQSEKLYDLRR